MLPLEAWLERARRAWPRREPGPARVHRAPRQGAQGRRASPCRSDFPAGLYTELRDLGLQVRYRPGALFPEREIKSRRRGRGDPRGKPLQRGRASRPPRALLRACRIRAGRLVHRGSVLTSERLKVAIETACIEAGSVSSSTIAAGGDQACDPHNAGSGPLRANELIIVDVFPRVSATGFHGDMTRTFLRGRASDAQRAIVGGGPGGAARRRSATIRAGVNGMEVHRRVVRDLRRPRIRDPAHAPRDRSGSSTAPATASASRSTSPRG